MNDENQNIIGMVFDIKKFAIHDGPGIRTTVFLKGCPLSCLWCHNPESQDSAAELSFIPDKCVGCGFCFKTCPNQCHVMKDGAHVLLRDRCRRCGACAAECHARALEVVGETMTVRKVIDEVLKDKPFYETSGGGMTISGGEPMAQFEFTKGLLTAARDKGLRTCLDTSGFAPFERLENIRPVVDLFLFDLKETNPDKHRKWTGVALEPILENLRGLDRAGAKIILRCPIIPGLNDRDDHFAGLADVANQLSNVMEINLHPYHPLGESKSDRTGKTYALPNKSFPDDDVVKRWERTLADMTHSPVKRN